MSGGSQTQTTNSAPWAPAQPYLKEGLGLADKLYKSGGMTTNYSGDWIADMTDGQLGALQGVIGAAGSNNETLGGVAGSLAGLATGATQADTWGTIADDTIRRIMPSINSSFAGSGMTGSTLHQDNLSRGMSGGLASAYSDYANTAVQQQLGATSALGGVLGQILGNNQAAYDAETALQSQEQNELDSQYQNSILGQNADLEGLQNYLSLISGIGGMGSSSTTTAQKSGGLLGNIFSGIATIAKMSDRRLKENIRRVGTLDNGLGVYLYTYKGGSEPQIGVMADEVEQIIPHAVTEMHGYKAVNYGAL